MASSSGAGFPNSRKRPASVAYPEEYQGAMTAGIGARQGWRYVEGGLATIAAKYGTENTIERAREEFKVFYGEDFCLPMTHETEDFDSLGTNTVVTSMDTPLSSDNIGFRLVAKMGWQTGTGLGSRQQGRVEPIRVDTSVGTLGIGKVAQDEQVTADASKQRKLMEAELQVIETDKQREDREERNARQQRIQEEVTQQKAVFLCKLCNKQYTVVGEWENHLSSYDHHHKARFEEMRQLQNVRKAEEARSKQGKREEKETQRLMDMANKAAAAAEAARAASMAVGAGAAGGTAVSAVGAPVDANSGSSIDATNSAGSGSLAAAPDRPALTLSFGMSLGGAANDLKRKPIGFSLSTSGLALKKKK